jgi:hypothetical protein
MDVSLEKELKVESDFAVAGGMLNLSASADGVFQVVIPSMPRGQGGGEHKDRWNPEAGTKDEDEEYGNWQEAFVTTYDLPDPAGMCDAHLYLKDRSYIAGAKINVRFVNNKFGATISDIRPDRTPEFHRDGCTADILLFIGSIIDNMVDNKIKDLLADKIGNLQIRIGNQQVGMVPKEPHPLAAGTVPFYVIRGSIALQQGLASESSLEPTDTQPRTLSLWLQSRKR